MNSWIPRQDLVDWHAMMRSSTIRQNELIETSRVAIDESRALLYEISRRHPEIDFDVMVRE